MAWLAICAAYNKRSGCAKLGGMETSQAERRPGDLILDRHMPTATEDEREAARETLRAYAAVVLRIATRLATEEYENAIRANATGAVNFPDGKTPSL